MLTYNGFVNQTMTSQGNITEHSRCSKWVYDRSVFESTVATDFDVVCDRSVYRATSNMMAEIGCLLGILTCGFLADKFGRKVPFCIGGLALIVGGFGIAFSTNFIILNICRFAVGIARMALWVNGLVIGMEIVGPSKRVFAGIFIELVWCIGLFLLLIFAFFIRNWRYLEIAVSVPSVILLAYWWLIPESPRWLASQGREKEVRQVLEKIAASNKTKLPEVDDVKELLEAEETLSLRHLLRSRELLVNMLIVFSNMFVLCLSYTALLYNVSNLAGDVFINYLINALLETMGLVCPIFLLDRFGRRPVYCTCVLIGGAACVLTVFPAVFGAPEWVIVTLSMVGRFFVCAAFAIIYVYGAELFPTVIRGSAIGMAVTFSRLGGVLAPYVADVGVLLGGTLKSALPLIVMGSPSLLIGVFAFCLPETRGAKLPETLDDVNNTKRKRCLLCCPKADLETREVTVTPEDKDDDTGYPC